MHHGVLVIDVREACRPNRTGKAQWTHGFVSELLRRKIPVTLFTDADIPSEWLKTACGVIRIPGKGLRWHWNVLQWLRNHSGVTYVSPVSTIVPAFVPRSVRCIPVIHDLIAFMDEPHDRKAKLIERLTLPRAVRRAHHLCTISESTKRDLLRRYPRVPRERVTPVFAGPMHMHPEKPHPDAKTILCVATLCPRKNQLRLIKAFTSLPEDLRNSHQLILAGGRGWDDDEIVCKAKNTAGVQWRGYIDAAAYESLLNSCHIFALPSLYEGFGMQILDALQRGIPVLTSNRGSLKELAEGAALIVDPEDVASIVQGLETLLTDDGLRKHLSQKAIQRSAVYSWRRTVDLFLGTLASPC